LRFYKTFDSSANDVMMTRSAKQQHSALLLEGVDDERFYRNILHSMCLSFPLDGKEDVLGTLSVLSARGQVGVAGVIDADCDHLNGHACPANVFRTDFRDVECFLVSSGALGKVLNEHLIRESPASLRPQLFRACSDLGLLRWEALKQGWHISFKVLDYARFIDARTLTPDRLKLCTEVLRTNPGFALSEQDLVDSIVQAENPNHPPLHVCSGHDLTAILAMWISNKRKVAILAKEIESQLRLSVGLASIAQTKMVGAMRSWEKSNAPFRILGDAFAAPLPKQPSA
jgi:Protein of unknown function (DUF4435)